jgi:hypothetical protein
VTISWSCVFLDHNLKLSLNRALLKWCFGKVATLRWRLLLRPQDCSRLTGVHTVQYSMALLFAATAAQLLALVLFRKIFWGAFSLR